MSAARWVAARARHAVEQRPEKHARRSSAFDRGAAPSTYGGATCRCRERALAPTDPETAPLAPSSTVGTTRLPAAGTKLGAASAIGYEYPERLYAGPLAHMGGAQCTSCHDPAASQHSFSIADTWDSRCGVCHADANGDPENVRLVHLADYDGDSDTSESLRAEIDGMAAALLVAMRGAAGEGGLCYEPAAYPYFFGDPSGDGVCSAEEATSANAFTPWTAQLMQAAHTTSSAAKTRAPGPTTSTTSPNCSSTARRTSRKVPGH